MCGHRSVTTEFVTSSIAHSVSGEPCSRTRAAVHDGGAVVVIVRVGREGEDKAVDAGGGDADGEARRGAAQLHEAGGDVAVEVDAVIVARGGVREATHLPNHGEDDWDGFARVWHEGHV